jgi:hypothetical protein
MLVYGDVATELEATELQAALVARLGEIARMPPSRARHEALVAILIRAGQLVGGLLDNAFHARGEEEVTPRDGMFALTAIAYAVDRSWRSGFTEFPDLVAARDHIARLEAAGDLQIKPAEGYAFYALYPELYAEAARRSGLPPGTRVVGIRSIGTSLAPMVAAALGASPPLTVRPAGHPFDRDLRLAPDFAEQLLAGSPPAYAIVDEGPGLSGSSFASVADWLAAHGIPRTQIHRFPSHPNQPGAMAGPARMANWRASPSHFVPFEELLPRLVTWVEELVGPLTAPLTDIAGGQWRDHVSPLTAASPAAPGWERRKYLAVTEQGRFLIKFAGLSDDGHRKLELARGLHAAALSPEPIGLAHGFLVTRWFEAPGLLEAGVARAQLIDQLAGYLTFRAAIPASSGGGLAMLRDMALHNTAEAIGDEAAAQLAADLPEPSPLQPLVHRIETDNRLHAWEWLVADGHLVKTDGLDHAHAHDFVGPQDIAWDIAGAIVEHDLTRTEAEALQTAVAKRSGRPAAPELLAFLLPCYIAFQLGAWTMALGREAPVTRRYAERLAMLIRTSRMP